MTRERRMCLKCKRPQYHVIADKPIESKDFIFEQKEETCEVCGSKRLVTSGQKVLKPR